MNERRFALIVASYQYDDSELRTLQAPAQDAEDLYHVLSNPDIGGFECEILCDAPAHEVSRKIEAFFTDRKQDDLLLLYFSGHGIKDEAGHLYLAMSDTKRKLLRSTAIPASFINESMRRSRSQRQILLLDCCYSGAFARGMVVKADQDVGTGEHFKGRGRIILTASDSMQYAFEEDIVKGKGIRSIFTRTLVEGLETGKADIDQDGYISIDDLYMYIYENITDKLPEQEPRKWMLDIQGEIFIARNPKRLKGHTFSIFNIFQNCYQGLDSQKKWLPTKGEEDRFFEQSTQNYITQSEHFHSTMRILRMKEPVTLRNIYTRVNVLKKITSQTHVSTDDLMSLYELRDRELYVGRQSTIIRALSRRRFQDQRLIYAKETMSGIEAVENLSKIFLLGKPGSGKTTFLKYIFLQALDGKLSKTYLPIFVEIRDLVYKNQSLRDYIIDQFSICEFPDYFVHNLMKSGKCLLLLDGLDEMKSDFSEKVINDIEKFSTEYHLNDFIITCRIGAYDYCFEKFNDIEMADFSDAQVSTFISNWFKGENIKAGLFLNKIKDDISIREMSYNPLLLTMLCLMFDEIMEFPKNRAELYKEAIDALLRRWDASRMIKRDIAYKNLSIKHKESLLSRIAAISFSQDQYFLRKSLLEKYIADFIANLPSADDSNISIDSESILRSIEYQHGLFVERAKNLYSFSHVSFQEYFTGKYIVDNATKGTVDNLVKSYLHSHKWFEVFIIVSGMLEDADDFIALIKEEINKLSNDLNVNRLLNKIRLILTRSESYYLPSLSIASVLYWLIESRIGIADERDVHLIDKKSSHGYEEEILSGIMHVDNFHHDIMQDLLQSFVLNNERARHLLKCISNNTYRSSCLVHTFKIHPQISKDFSKAIMKDDNIKEIFLHHMRINDTPSRQDTARHRTSKQRRERSKMRGIQPIQRSEGENTDLDLSAEIINNMDKFVYFLRMISEREDYALKFSKALIESRSLIHYLPYIILPPGFIEENMFNFVLNRTTLDKIVSFMKANRLLLKCIMSAHYISKDLRMKILDELLLPQEIIRA